MMEKETLDAKVMNWQCDECHQKFLELPSKRTIWKGMHSYVVSEEVSCPNCGAVREDFIDMDGKISGVLHLKRGSRWKKLLRLVRL